MTNKMGINSKLLRFAWWGLAVVVFSLVIAIRVRLMGMPLERDEGEYAYAGQLMLQGVPPYKLAYNMKFPGTYAAYAGIMAIFGQTISGIHLGLLLINAATIVLIFFLGRRLINSTAGIAAAASYAVLSVSPFVLGLAGHATHFVVLPVLGGALLLLKEGDRRSRRTLFASGFLFGIGLLMKQPAISFVLFGATYLVSKDVQRRLDVRRILLRGLTFGAGAIFPFAFTCLLLWYAGVFGKFWFWTIDYARQYAGLVPLTEAPRLFSTTITLVMGAAWPLWTLAGIGVVTGLCSRQNRASAVFSLELLAFSALAASAGFYFRSHYFIMVLPAISLFIGIAATTLSDFAARHASAFRLLPLFLLGVALSMPIFRDRKCFFAFSPVQACRWTYPEHPFPESLRTAEYVREHTEPNDTIAVLGSEPEIYFYSNRHSATGYIYMYGLMEPQKYARQMQEEMIEEVERARPKYLICMVTKYAWAQRPQSDRLIFNWANEYPAQNYVLDGLVTMTPTETDYFFGYVPQPIENLKTYILIYKRRF